MQSNLPIKTKVGIKLQKNADLRGPKTPFSIDGDGEQTFHAALLGDQLKAAGYQVQDSRKDSDQYKILLAPLSN